MRTILDKFKEVNGYDSQNLQINITEGRFRAEFEIYIMSKPEDNLDENRRKIHDEAFNVALNIIEYIDNNPSWQGILRVHDYDIKSIYLKDYTEQRNTGVLLSLIIEMPNGFDKRIQNGEVYLPLLM